MFEREMMIMGLQKQRQMLTSLIEEIEKKSCFQLSDWSLCQERAAKVASNLRKLRKIKSQYFTYKNLIAYS